MDDNPPPTGWTRLLNGQRFTDATNVGLVASGARPGRVAGCALPAGLNTSATPVFVLSDDAGVTWQLHPTPAGKPTTDCMVLADAEQPDTFVVWTDTLIYTTDAGMTWRTVPKPPGLVVDLTGMIPSNTTITLVGGTLLALLGQTFGDRLAELTLGRSVTWKLVDTSLLQLVHATSPSVDTTINTPEALALDPQDPARIYAAMPLGAKGVDIFRSDDSGGVWRSILSLPTTERVQLWTAQQHRVYVENLFDQKNVPYLFFASDNDGATWVGSGLHGIRASSEPLFVSPGGVVIDFDLNDSTLYTFDPLTGRFAFLNADAVVTERTFSGVVTDGAHPQFIVLTAYDTYALPLPG